MIELINLNQNVLGICPRVCLRNYTISFSAGLKKNYLEQLSALESKCGELERKFGCTFSKETEQKLNVERAALNDLLRQRTEYLMLITKQKYYIDGSKPSWLYVLTLKKNPTSNVLTFRQSKALKVVSPLIPQTSINSESWIREIENT